MQLAVRIYVRLLYVFYKLLFNRLLRLKKSALGAGGPWFESRYPDTAKASMMGCLCLLFVSHARAV